MRVSSLPIRSGRVRGVVIPNRQLPARSGNSDGQSVIWLRAGSVAAVVFDRRDGPRYRGVALLDVKRGRLQVIDRAATAMTLSGGMLVTHAPGGLRAYSATGRRVRSVPGTAGLLAGLQARADRVYLSLLRPDVLQVVDMRRGTVVANLTSGPALRAVIDDDCTWSSSRAAAHG